MTLPESILPSRNLPRPPRIYPLPLDMRPSHNLSIPPEFTSFWCTICNAHIIYPSLPENNPPPPAFKHLYATLTESTLRPKIYPNFKHLRPSQNLPLPPRFGYPPFLTTIFDTSIIHPSLPEYTPFYSKCGSQNLTHLSRIYPLFYNYICDAPRIYPALPEYTPPPFRNTTLPEYTHPSRIYPLLHYYMRHSHNRPLP